MNEELLSILACPICHGKLLYQALAQELICPQDKLAYPIRDAIPVMLPEEARSLREEEL